MSSALSSDQYLLVVALRRCLLTSISLFWRSGSWVVAAKSIYRSCVTPGPAWSGKTRWVAATFLPKLTVLCRRTLLLVSDRPAGRAIRQGVVVTKLEDKRLDLAV